MALSEAFVLAPATSTPTLRGSTAGARASREPLPLAGGFLTAAAAAAVGRTVCRAAAVKKKGVKVVHGKEIPWNLFSPKAPYQGKVVANDFHPQTLTEPTGDANWETTHVTFDHGGKVPYIEGRSGSTEGS